MSWSWWETEKLVGLRGSVEVRVVHGGEAGSAVGRSRDGLEWVELRFCSWARILIQLLLSRWRTPSLRMIVRSLYSWRRGGGRVQGFALVLVDKNGLITSPVHFMPAATAWSELNILPSTRASG